MRRNKDKLRYFGVLVCVFFLFAAGLQTGAGAGEKFPKKSVKLIVPTPPGGGTDIMSRILADAAEPFLGQKLVVINKPGGSGTVGINVIVKARADGYTLGSLWNSPLTMVPHVLKVPYTLDDLTFITQLTKGAMLFAVRSEFPAKTAEEFFEYVRKTPGLTYAGDGVGNTAHFSWEKISQVKNAKLRLVPYGGAGESIKALLGGHVDIYCGSVPPALSHIKAGKVRAILVTTKGRVPVLPKAAGVSDLGHPEAATILWRGIIGPKGIPTDRIEILGKALRQGAQSQKMKDLMRKKGEEIVASSAKDFEELVRSEFAANAAVAKRLGLAPK